MRTWIALFRGINVGGNNILPMKSLAALLEELGCVQVRTYIQSGNAVFQSAEANSAKLAQRIAKAVAKAHGFEPRVLLLESTELRKAAAANPFPTTVPKAVHLWFLTEHAKKPDLAALEKLKAAKERFALKGSTFYLHAPNGIGKSKLAARVEKALGVDATARNWNTVTKLLELTHQLKS